MLKSHNDDNCEDVPSDDTMNLLGDFRDEQKMLVPSPGAAPPNPTVERGKWAVGNVQAAFCTNQPYCCAAFFCPCCCIFRQRVQLLENDMRNYECCAGMLGSVSTYGTTCCGNGCGLCLESTFCSICAITANRNMLQKKYNLSEDDTAIKVMWLSYFGGMVAPMNHPVPQCMSLGFNLVSHTASTMLLAQQDYEINFRRPLPGTVMN